jgi:predicted O-methyltransferase YrrM
MRWKSMEIPAGNSMEIGPVFGFSTHWQVAGQIVAENILLHPNCLRQWL